MHMKWAGLLPLLLFASALAAQEGNKGVHISDLIVPSEPTVNKEGKLELGKDRVGIGLDWKILSFGYDDNVLNVDRHKDTSAYMDSAAEAWFGLNLGIVEAGVRGRIDGRYLFDADNDFLYDLKLGGFVRKQARKGGDIGFGVTADVLYQQPTYYELTGPILRFEKTKRAGIIGRANFQYAPWSFLCLELGVNASHSDFNEDNLDTSADYWEIGTDFRVHLRFWEFLEITPYVKFDYDWFRDVFDQNDDGSLSGEDKLQLLKFTGAADVKFRLGEFFGLVGNVHFKRQDDSAQGFHRYYQYGFDAAAEIRIAIVRIYLGAKAWNREYLDRADFNDDGTEETLFERDLGMFAEVRVTVWWHIYVGVRVDWDRRTSGIDNRGFANGQYAGFFGLGF